jgi:hypothetical protein
MKNNVKPAVAARLPDIKRTWANTPTVRCPKVMLKTISPESGGFALQTEVISPSWPKISRHEPNQNGDNFKCEREKIKASIKLEGKGSADPHEISLWHNLQ